MKKSKKENRIKLRRKNRVRSVIFGTGSRPRLSVFRSNRWGYVQLIDDEKGNTLAAASTKDIKGKESRIALAERLGQLIAKKAQDKGVKKVVFDRGPYKYHGLVEAIARGARAGGLQF